MPNYIAPLSVSSTGTAGTIVASGSFPFSAALCSTVIIVNPSTSDLTITPGSGNALSITARAGSVTIARWVSATLNTFEVTQVSATTASASGSIEFTDDILPPGTSFLGNPTVDLSGPVTATITGPITVTGDVGITGTPAVTVDTSGGAVDVSGPVTVNNTTSSPAYTQAASGEFGSGITGSQTGPITSSTEIWSPNSSGYITGVTLIWTNSGSSASTSGNSVQGNLNGTTITVSDVQIPANSTVVMHIPLEPGVLNNGAWCNLDSNVTLSWNAAEITKAGRAIPATIS